MVEKQGNLQKFESESVTFSVEENPGCIVRCEAFSSSDLVKKARNDGIQSLSKEVTLPGFRKGKAPFDLILKKFPESVDEKWKKTLADYTFRACQKVTHFPILSDETSINFHVETCSIDEGAKIIFTFETEPTVPKINLNDLELREVKRDAIDEMQIETTLADIQRFFVEWTKSPESTVKEGDFAVIQLDIVDQDPPETVLPNGRFEVKKEKIAQWMYETLLGMEVGTTREAISKPDPEVSEEQREGIPLKKVQVTLKRIEIANYPPIDDNLAQKVGAKDVSTLRENLTHLLNKQADERVKDQYRDQLITYLLETYPFELPRTLRQRETHTRLNQLKKSASLYKHFLDQNEEGKKEIIQQIESQGEKALRLFYICRDVLNAHQISILPEDPSPNSLTPLDALFQGSDSFYGNQEDEHQTAEMIAARSILKKAENFLISKAKIVPSPSQKDPGDQASFEESATKEDKGVGSSSKEEFQENT